MKKYEVKIPMCLSGIIEATSKEEAEEIAHDTLDVKTHTCDFWDIVKTEVIDITLDDQGSPWESKTQPKHDFL